MAKVTKTKVASKKKQPPPQDFGVNYVEQTLDFMNEEKKTDILSWRDFIRYTKPKLEQKDN